MIISMGANCSDRAAAFHFPRSLDGPTRLKCQTDIGMTVLTLTVGQAFHVGELLVTVKAIEGEVVVFEFDNSDSDHIQRGELYGVLWTPRRRPQSDLSSNAG